MSFLTHFLAEIDLSAKPSEGQLAFSKVLAVVIEGRKKQGRGELPYERSV